MFKHLRGFWGPAWISWRETSHTMRNSWWRCLAPAWIWLTPGSRCATSQSLLSVTPKPFGQPQNTHRKQTRQNCPCCCHRRCHCCGYGHLENLKVSTKEWGEVWPTPPLCFWKPIIRPLVMITPTQFSRLWFIMACLSNNLSAWYKVQSVNILLSFLIATVAFGITIRSAETCCITVDILLQSFSREIIASISSFVFWESPQCVHSCCL